MAPPWSPSRAGRARRSRHGCSPATVTESSSSTAAARARARATRTASAGEGSRISMPPLRISGCGRMSTRTGSASSASRSGARWRSLRDELANPGLRDRLLDLPAQVSLIAALTVFSDELAPPSLNSEVARIAPTPVFFVYGEHGQGGSEARPNKGFYAAAGEPKQVWEVPNGQHIAGITTEPEEYERRVIG